jgi:succinyl-CoA synthetase alpha subunit
MMAVLVNEQTRLIVQGLTGREGGFHAEQCLKYGTQVVAGVTPGKGGTVVTLNQVDIPVFNTVAEAKAATQANATVIFVPPPAAADAITEATLAGVSLVICITEGIPILDMMKVKHLLADHPEVTLVGPNCPGVISPGLAKIGIMPGHIHMKGAIGVVSRSGTLTYEAVDQLTQRGLGQSTCIGIGGDPVNGMNFTAALTLFENDPETEAIIMIGEIGGSAEVDAAKFAQTHVTKPIVCFIAGQAAPAGKRMGHAGALVGGVADTAAEKMRLIAECGITVVDSPAKLGSAMAEVLAKKKTACSVG